MPDKEYGIDDITWNDLDLDLFLKSFDRTCSRNGGEYLYDMLRRPLITKEGQEELKERGRVSDIFRKDTALRDRYIRAFEEQDELKNDCFHDRLESLKDAGTDSDLVHISALILGVVSLCLIFIYPPAGFVMFLIASGFNVFTYFKRKAETDPYIPVIRYLIKELKENKKIPGAPGLEAYRKKLDTAGDRLKSLESFSWIVFGGKNLTGGIMDLPLDFIRIFFHPDLIKYNSMIRVIKREMASVRELFDVTGFLDAMISLSFYKESLFYYSEPVFKDKGGIEVRRGYHPLLKSPVCYDIEGVSHMLLTGSNASGKSTFLKSVALSLLLSETVYLAPAEYFSTVPVEIFSSMSLRDDIAKGDSLYVTEIKSIRRIVERLRAGAGLAVFLDEVIKGTNTVERIASLSSLLKSFSECSVCFAATHDTPLTEILENIYDNYHFDELVTKDGISFPYELKKGRTESRDAIALLSVMGFDEEITKEAFSLSDTFMKEGVWERLKRK